MSFLVNKKFWLCSVNFRDFWEKKNLPQWKYLQNVWDFCKVFQHNLHPFRFFFHKRLLDSFFSDIHWSFDSCNKNRTKSVSSRDNAHFLQYCFCMPIFLQWLLISWFWLFLSNSFNILRLFTKCHLLKFTFKDFTGLSLLQISVQMRNSMQIFWGSNSTFWTHQA